MKINFHKKHPTQPGKYLTYSPTFGINLITVVIIPKSEHYDLPEYLGVIEHGYRNVLNLNLDCVAFSDELELGEIV